MGRIHIMVAEVKRRMMTTDIVRWRVVVSSVLLAILCSITVFSVIYLIWSTEGLSCFEGVVVMSLVWLCAELFIIYYLLFEKMIPAYARGAAVMLMLVGNYWLGMFAFSLHSCEG